jgi:pre-rRNA-processing protein TSR1
MLLKRTVLTGFPVKVEGRFAVGRSMFFQSGDIDWFKPIGVHTKSGAQGHIGMSIGTHGRMKLRFDKPITQADVICLPLYKRVFPRWGRGYKNAYPVLASHEARDKGLFGQGAGSGGLASKAMATEEL